LRHSDLGLGIFPQTVLGSHVTPGHGEAAEAASLVNILRQVKKRQVDCSQKGLKMGFGRCTAARQNPGIWVSNQGVKALKGTR
jgi:hypothetical protein